MSAGWVAGTVRAHGLIHHQLGDAEARSIAEAGSLPAALRQLTGRQYGRLLSPEQSLGAAQHAVWAGALWNLRVLAGWLPPQGLVAIRAVAGWFEIANADDHLDGFAGARMPTPFELGPLRTAWPVLATTRSVTEFRQALAVSAWGDPGTEDPEQVRVAMRAALASRVARAMPEAGEWADSALALMLARRLFLRRGGPGAVPRVVTARLGRAAVNALSLPDLREQLPSRIRWAIGDSDDPTQLWRMEFGWWRHVDADATHLFRAGGTGRARLAGLLGMMAADSWRVAAALAIAARGGTAEVFDDAA